MTNLSVNINKLALLRNSRGRDYPNLIDFAQRILHYGVQGLTIHPRQDERHITKKDAKDLSSLVRNYTNIELNIEGYPTDEFMCLMEDLKPHQCTFVPDSPSQLTSDHGWNLFNDKEFELVTECCKRLNELNIRTAIFMDPEPNQICLVPETYATRIELYTELYASSYHSSRREEVLHQYKEAALKSHELGIGVNAGHDLDLINLAHFLTIPSILEVSIGHALIVESIEQGMETVIRQYLDLCK